MSVKLGNSAKDSQYLKRIKEAIEKDSGHPRHHGVLMQAHHIISAEGVKRSGLGRRLEKLGYDINVLSNLVFIPCTLQGACYLGVQPHRGNHVADVDQDDYDDDGEPLNYHKMIDLRLKDLKLPLSKECPGDKKERRKEVQESIDKLSKDILGLIQNKPSAAPLTNIAKYFSTGNSVGCGGVDFVDMDSDFLPCYVERNHRNKQAPGQKNENITYVCNGKYNLKVGQ